MSEPGGIRSNSAATISQHLSKKVIKRQALAVCGPGRIFGAPGGSLCQPNIAQITFLKALRETRVYRITKSYFSTVSRNETIHRTDMQSAKSMFKRETTNFSQIQTQRAQHIQKGVEAEREMLRFRASADRGPKFSTLSSGMLEAEHPHPNEGEFATAQVLTYNRLTKHSARKLAHMAELQLLAYEELSDAPP